MKQHGVCAKEEQEYEQEMDEIKLLEQGQEEEIEEQLKLIWNETMKNKQEKRSTHTLLSLIWNTNSCFN